MSFVIARVITVFLLYNTQLNTAVIFLFLPFQKPYLCNCLLNTEGFTSARY